MTEDLILALVLMAIAGGAIGFVSAMLGIGGGMLMVPALLLIIGLLEVPPDKRMHVAAGTSLCIMIATALGSVVSHARRGNVVWVIVLRVVPGIVVGVIGGSLLAHVLASHVLGVIFAVVLLLVGLLMIFGFKATPEAKKTPGFVPSTAAGSIIGFKSGLLGVGGGALSVPWLTSRGLPQNEVSGTSSCFTLPAAIVGTVAFMLTGMDSVKLPLMVGYVFWPALPAAGGVSLIATFFGAKFASKVPGRALRIAFGVLVICVAISMFFA